MVKFIDDCTGRILKKLHDLGLEKNTIVIFTTDHGEILGDHYLLYKGPFLFDKLVRVPCIIKSPFSKLRGAAVNQKTAHYDLFSTILEIADIPQPPYCLSKSLVHLLDGSKETHRERVLTEHDNNIVGMLFCMHSEHWKIILYGRYPWGELYNLKDDPHEFYNLYDEPGYRTIREKLTRELISEVMNTQAEWPEKTY
jgi:arylsulfatase